LREEQQTHILGLTGTGEARVAVPEEPAAQLHVAAELFYEDI